MNRRERRASRKQGGGATKAAASPAQSLLGEALRQHQARQLDQAEQLYRRILADAPTHPTALANMGMLLHQRRALDEAEKSSISCATRRSTPN
jgi:Flp pilus assembly protein TadD